MKNNEKEIIKIKDEVIGEVIKWSPKLYSVSARYIPINSNWLGKFKTKKEATNKLIELKRMEYETLKKVFED